MHVFAGIIIGGIIGYVTGKYMSKFGFGCPLICNPEISALYFAIIGLFIAAGE